MGLLNTAIGRMTFQQCGELREHTADPMSIIDCGNAACGQKIQPVIRQWLISPTSQFHITVNRFDTWVEKS